MTSETPETRSEETQEDVVEQERTETPAAEGEPSAGAAAADEAAPAEEPTGEPEVEEPPVEELRPLDVYAVLRVSIAQLSGIAFQMMGLQADPITNKIRKDLEQARVAIDATASLVEKLLPHLEGQDARDAQNLLTDLRLNFIRQSGDDEKPE
jgi:hypothetical protein